MNIHDILELTLNTDLAKCKRSINKTEQYSTKNIAYNERKEVVYSEQLKEFISGLDAAKSTDTRKIVLFNDTINGITLQVVCKFVSTGVNSKLLFYTFMNTKKAPFFEKIEFRTDRANFYVPLKVTQLYKFLVNLKQNNTI